MDGIDYDFNLGVEFDRGLPDGAHYNIIVCGSYYLV